jgi:hypothetical protein
MKKPAGAMWLALVLVACSVSREPLAKRSAVHTTSGSIAIANLDHAIAQTKDEAGVVELLLTRSRFLADYEALERAATISEEHVESAADFLRRARTRAAVHRFADALGDVAAAERLGADGGATVNAQRQYSSQWVARAMWRRNSRRAWSVTRDLHPGRLSPVRMRCLVGSRTRTTCMRRRWTASTPPHPSHMRGSTSRVA